VAIGYIVSAAPVLLAEVALAAALFTAVYALEGLAPDAQSIGGVIVALRSAR
jgi:hypothetical protein